MSTNLQPNADAATAEDMEQQVIEQETQRLRCHLGLEEDPDEPNSSPPNHIPLFFIERAPYSHRGAKCKLPTCPNNILLNEYRVALNPGMHSPAWIRSSNRNSDFYHVKCFEKIADLSRSEYLDRISPVTRRTFHLRGIQSSSIFDGNYLCDGGAEILICEWKVQRGRWLDKQAGVEQKTPDPALDNLLRNAGSSTFKYEEVENISWHEKFLLLNDLAPIESDGPEDKEEWNLFKEYLPGDEEEDKLHDQHSLSKILSIWKMDRFLVFHDDADITPSGLEAKRRLNEKAMRAIRRLATVQMPDFHGAIFGSRE